MIEEQERIMIVGAQSKTAEAVERVLSIETHYDILSVSRTPTETSQNTAIGDITDRKALKALCMKFRPTVIVNTAAYTDVDGSETNRQEAWTVNVKGVENLVQMCRLFDARLIHFSTDYVFDGTKGPYTEEDKPMPLGYYGKTKLASENICKTGNIPYSIIRTNVLYGSATSRHTDFVRWVLQKLIKNEPLRIVDDQYSNPTFIDDLGHAVELLIKRKRYGIYHISGADWINRWDFAKRIAKTFGYADSSIQPIKTAELQQASPRPMHGGLVTLKAETDLRMKMTGVESGLSTLKQRLQQLHNK